jgi:hypothetical protein
MQDVEKTELTEESQVQESSETLIQEEQEAGETPAKSEEPKSEEDKISKMQKAFDKRIAKATAEKYHLKEQLKEARAKVQDYSQRPAPPDPQKFIDQYGNVNRSEYNKAFGEYEDLRDNWKDAQSKSVKEEEIDTQEIVRHQSKFIEKGAKLADKYPDWYEIINKPIWTPKLSGYLYGTENPELAIYLGKREDEAKRIGNLPIDEMEAELEAIEAKMKIPVRPVTKLPDPLSPVDDAKYVNVKNIDDIENDQEWMNARKKERLKKLRG